MRLCDHVSSEGGPILIADAAVAQAWCGAEGEMADYLRACEAVLASPGAIVVPVSGGSGLIWDMGGAGTCDIFLDDNDNVVIVRPWLEDCEVSEEDGIMLRFAEVPKSTTLGLTEIQVDCGVLAVLWAAETGKSIDSLDVVGSMRPNTRIMGSDDWGLLVSVPNGRYVCFLDEFETNEGDARRCHLFRDYSG